MPVDASRTIYLDWNAAPPPHADVVAAMGDAAERCWANPASLHGVGQAARAMLEDARQAVAELLGFDPAEITFVSGGTEANNLALSRALATSGAGPGALLVSAQEHPSVLRVADVLQARGVEVERVAPEPSGVTPAAAFAEALERLGGRVRWVSLQAVNHETGVIQPVSAVAELAHARGARLHVDAVQAVGKLDPVAWSGADVVTMSSHKIRGPKGLGVVAAIPAVRLEPLFHGGGQERGLRPGTQDAVAAAGLTVAAHLARSSPAVYRSLGELRDDLEQRLIALGRRRSAEPVRNGTAPRTGQVSNLSWPDWSGPELCAALDLEGVAVSSGAACSAGTAEPSAVIRAAVGAERAASAVRISVGETTAPSEVDEALAAWDRVLRPRLTR